MIAIRIILFTFLVLTITFTNTQSHAVPKGAKAIFESGEGIAILVDKSKPSTSKPTQSKEKYVGIAYQLMLIKPDGSFTPVSKYRTFRSGERLKILVQTNRPGYLTIMNIGPTGNTHILYDEQVEAFKLIEIPKISNLLFTGPAGTEKLLIMLSDEPNPITKRDGMSVQVPSSSPSQGSHSGMFTPPNELVASLEDAKRMKGTKGSKDLIVEDRMKSIYAVVSPQTGYKPVSKGAKDIIVESSGGVNYGVVPVSAIAGGGMLTLQINLTHK